MWTTALLSSSQRFEARRKRPKIAVQSLVAVAVAVEHEDKHHQFKYLLDRSHTFYSIVVHVLDRNLPLYNNWLQEGTWIGGDNQALDLRSCLFELAYGQYTFKGSSVTIVIQLDPYDKVNVQQYATYCPQWMLQQLSRNPKNSDLLEVHRMQYDPVETISHMPMQRGILKLEEKYYNHEYKPLFLAVALNESATIPALVLSLDRTLGTKSRELLVLSWKSAKGNEFDKDMSENGITQDGVYQWKDSYKSLI
jgi:hypothetical protein